MLTFRNPARTTFSSLGRDYRNATMKINTLAKMAFLLALTAPMSDAQTITLMYATTPTTRSTNGGTRNTNALLNTKFADQGRVTSRSNLDDIVWERATNFETTYNNERQTSGTQLRRLETNRALRSLRDFRDERNADVLQLWCNWTNTSVGGQARRPGGVSVMRRTLLSVTFGNTRWVSAHEVGHNLNAIHSHGFCYDRNRRRTIMETGSGSCGSASLQGVFSSTTERFGGFRTGNASNQNRERVEAQADATSRQQ